MRAAAFLACLALAGCGSPEPMSKAEEAELVLRSTYEREVKALLKDPESAQFTDVTFHQGGPVPVICGKVNSKNGFGGYGGPQGFVYSGAAFVEEQMADGEWEKAASQFCIG